MVARTIVGPQDRFERTGVESMRDIRPFTTRLSEGLRAPPRPLCCGGGRSHLVRSGVIDLTVPMSVLYAALGADPPGSAADPAARIAPRPDHSIPGAGLAQARRRPMATIFIGWDHRRPGTLDHHRGRAPARHHPRHHRRGQDHGDPVLAQQRADAGLGLRAGRRQGSTTTLRRGARARAPLRPRGRRPRRSTS